METTKWFQSVGRYHFDFGECSPKNGFAQIDTTQDTAYFGQWANPFTLTIMSYAEGDCVRMIAATPDEFVQAMNEIYMFHVRMGDWKGIDTLCNEKTRQRFIALGLEELLYRSYRRKKCL